MKSARVVETFISRKPAKGSRWVGVLSVALCLAVSALCWEPNSNLGDRLSALPDRIFRNHEYWRAFTSMAVHADAEHLISNSLPLALLSSLIFGYYGFWIYPFSLCLAGALVMGISAATYPPGVYLMGASGLVYLMAGFWLMLFLFIDTRHSLGQRLFRAAGFSLIFLVPTSYKAGVSYRTHGIGFAVGLVFGGIYYLVKKDYLKSFERYAPQEVEGVFESDDDLPPPQWMN